MPPVRRRSQRISDNLDLHCEGDDGGFRSAAEDSDHETDDELEIIKTQFGDLSTDEQLIGLSNYESALSSSNSDLIKKNAVEAHLKSIRNAVKRDKLKIDLQCYQILGALPTYLLDQKKIDLATLSFVGDATRSLAFLSFRGDLTDVLSEYGDVKDLIALHGYGPETLRAYLAAFKKESGEKRWDVHLAGDLKAKLGVAVLASREGKSNQEREANTAVVEKSAESSHSAAASSQVGKEKPNSKVEPPVLESPQKTRKGLSVLKYTPGNEAFSMTEVIERKASSSKRLRRDVETPPLIPTCPLPESAIPVTVNASARPPPKDTLLSKITRLQKTIEEAEREKTDAEKELLKAEASLGRFKEKKLQAWKRNTEEFLREKNEVLEGEWEGLTVERVREIARGYREFGVEMGEGIEGVVLGKVERREKARERVEEVIRRVEEAKGRWKGLERLLEGVDLGG